MDPKDSLVEYLQGALAGRIIENPTPAEDCAAALEPFPEDAFVQVTVPPAVTTESRHEITVRVRHYLSGSAQGMVTLQGDDLARGTVYDFQAPFRIDPDRQVACIVFKWSVPRFPTKIKWSASVAFDGQMGVGLPSCSAATIVTRPMH